MLRNYIRKVNKLNDWVGKGIGWLLIPMTLVTAFEVVMRYIFNAPTIWAWDVNIQLLGAMTFLLGGYVLLRGGHVCVDIFPRMLSPRKRNILEIFLGLIFFFVFSLVLWQYAAIAAWSVSIGEKFTSLLYPPLFPLRVIAFIGIVLLYVQGIADFISRIYQLTSKEDIAL